MLQPTFWLAGTLCLKDGEANKVPDIMALVFSGLQMVMTKEASVYDTVIVRSQYKYLW